MGIGKLAATAWWLGKMKREDFGVRARAAEPAMTTARAKMRMADFMTGNPFLVSIVRR
jgi:hypothetical protein